MTYSGFTYNFSVYTYLRGKPPVVNSIKHKAPRAKDLPTCFIKSLTLIKQVIRRREGRTLHDY